MARIDPGPFGRTVAPAVRSAPAPRVVPEAFDTTSGVRELAGGLQAGSDVVAREFAYQQQQAKQAAEKAQREAEQAQRTEELTRARRDLVALGERATQQQAAILADDQIPGDQKQARFDDWLGQERQRLEPTYKLPEVAGAANLGMDEVGVSARAALSRGLTEQNQAKVIGNVADTLETLGRTALANGDAEPALRQAFDVLDATAAAAGWNAAEIQKRKADIAEGWTADVVAQRVNSDPRGALAALESGEYGRLDPSTRVALEHAARSEIERRDTRARVEAEARASKAARAVNSLSARYEAGIQPDAREVAVVSDLARGTEYEGLVAAMQAGAANRARFAASPMAEQAAELEAYRARAEDPAQGLSEAGAFDFKWRQRQFDATAQDIRARGALDAAASRGVIDLPPLDMSSPETIADGLARRRDAAAVASRWAGVAASPLTKDEITTFGQKLKGMPADQQSEVIDGFARAIGDPVDLKAAMEQLVPSNPAAASAGRLMIDTAPGAKEAATLILRGEDYISPREGERGRVLMPSERAFSAAFDDQVGTAYDGKPRVRQLELDNVRRVYAALSADEGDFTQDKSDVDSKRLQRAIEVATGGVAEYNDAPVVLPRAWDAGRFAEVMQDQIRLMNRAGMIQPGFTDEQLVDLQAENAPGGYYLRQGGAYVMDATGQRKAVIKPAAPLDWEALAAARDPGFDMPPAPVVDQPGDDQGTRRTAPPAAPPVDDMPPPYRPPAGARPSSRLVWGPFGYGFRRE